MSYFAPYIDAAGFHIPAYSDILNSLIASAQSIYGSDIYLGTDSADYQYMSAVSSLIYDSFLTSQLAYNSRSPATAIGAGLDSVVAINGIVRNPVTPADAFSTDMVTVTGTAGTTITGGIVQDANGNNWSLPSPTIIGSGGTVNVLATCQVPGAISALPNTVTTIVTPTLGWTSVTNPAAATVGTATESDSALRSRQAISTAQPSVTVLEGMQGALAALPGVTRFQVYENDTNAVDSLGIPANSICCVVEGGTSSAIANAIWARKTPGCGTFGTTTVDVTDQYNVVTPISYDVVSYTQIAIAYTVKMLNGYTSDTTAAIQSAAVSYTNGIPIGNTVYISGLFGAALSSNSNPSVPAFSVLSVQAAIVLGATLTTTLASGTAYTTLDVTALTLPIASGTSLVIGTGSTTQTITASASANVGDTSISLISFTANATYATGTPVTFALGTADIPIPYNQAAQTTITAITVTTQ